MFYLYFVHLIYFYFIYIYISPFFIVICFALVRLSQRTRSQEFWVLFLVSEKIAGGHLPLVT